MIAATHDDLFGAAAPVAPAIATIPDIVSPAQEAALIARIDAGDLSPFRFQGWLGRRLTTSYGLGYDFDSARLAPAAPIPDWLAPIRTRAALFAGLAADDLVQALLTRYDPGAGIGWHRDRPYYAHVIGISHGAAATLRLRRRVTGGFLRASLPLAPRAAYHLAGAARHEWEHSIAPMAQVRWSITLRSLSAKGIAALARL